MAMNYSVKPQPKMPQKARAKLHRQQGVSLLEVMVATAVIALLIPAIMAMVQPFLNFYGKVNTDNRLKDLRTALTATYNTYSTNIDALTTATLTTPDGTLSQVLPASQQCTATATTFAAARRFLSTSAGEIYHDGFGRSFCVWITPRLSASYSGVTYYYHNVLVVSAGVDGAVDATTTINADGTITVGGDDRSAFIDGRSIAQAKIQQTLAQMDKIVGGVSELLHLALHGQHLARYGGELFCQWPRILGHRVQLGYGWLDRVHGRCGASADLE